MGLKKIWENSSTKSRVNSVFTPGGAPPIDPTPLWGWASLRGWPSSLKEAPAAGAWVADNGPQGHPGDGGGQAVDPGPYQLGGDVVRGDGVGVNVDVRPVGGDELAHLLLDLEPSNPGRITNVIPFLQGQAMPFFFMIQSGPWFSKGHCDLTDRPHSNLEVANARYGHGLSTDNIILFDEGQVVWSQHIPPSSTFWCFFL